MFGQDGTYDYNMHTVAARATDARGTSIHIYLSIDLSIGTCTHDSIAYGSKNEYVLYISFNQLAGRVVNKYMQAASKISIHPRGSKHATRARKPHIKAGGEARDIGSKFDLRTF